MYCSKCRGENPPGATSCAHCGRKFLPPGAPRPAAAAVPATPGTPPPTAAAAPARPSAPQSAAAAAPGAAPAAAPDNFVATVIPYKNGPALIAYYLGVFSVIPCIGLPLGVAAVVLGIMGLKKAAAHPESKGKVHAWIGIIAGGLFALIYLALVIIMVLGPILAAMNLRSF